MKKSQSPEVDIWLSFISYLNAHLVLQLANFDNVIKDGLPALLCLSSYVIIVRRGSRKVVERNSYTGIQTISLQLVWSVAIHSLLIFQKQTQVSQLIQLN